MPRVLTCLRQQTVRDFELIVVVDGSTDNSVEVAYSFRSHFSNYRVINQENRGRAGVRNRGAFEATGELIIFYDDDMAPMPGSVQRHIAFHNSHTGILSGRSLDVAYSGDHDMQFYKAFISSSWFDKYSIAGVSELDFHNLFVCANNFSIMKSTFLQLQGFDSRLRDAEDYDLGVRALEQGIRVYFDNQNQAVHHDHITAFSYVRRLRQYGEAHDILAKLYPARAPQTIAQSVWWKRAVYARLASKRMLKAIDRGKFIHFPKKIRYRLYSAVFQALAVEFPNVEI